MHFWDPFWPGWGWSPPQQRRRRRGGRWQWGWRRRWEGRGEPNGWPHWLDQAGQEEEGAIECSIDVFLSCQLIFMSLIFCTTHIDFSINVWTTNYCTRWWGNPSWSSSATRPPTSSSFSFSSSSHSGLRISLGIHQDYRGHYHYHWVSW